MVLYAIIYFFLIYPITISIETKTEDIPEFHVSDEEILQLAKALRQHDLNGARQSQIVLDYQNHTTTHRSEKHVTNKTLFKFVDPELLRKETFERIFALYDNYIKDTGTIEIQTSERRNEEEKFLRAVFATELWKMFYNFLHTKGHPFAKDLNTLFGWINQLWFHPYSRARGALDTSAFEHVFIGEVKNGEISGLHSWIRFYNLEKNQSQNFNYHGYLIKRFNIMMTVKYSWFNALKRSGTFMVGTSPEYDLSIYTLCFLTRSEGRRCQIDHGSCSSHITSFKMIQRTKLYIGTAYPVIGRMTDACIKSNKN